MNMKAYKIVFNCVCVCGGEMPKYTFVLFCVEREWGTGWEVSVLWPMCEVRG